MAKVGRMREHGGGGAGGRSARRRLVALRRKLAGAGLISSYGAPFTTRFVLGGREERRKAHQGVVGAVGHRRGRAPKRGGRDHGRSPGR
jgi:hypothetical protein